MKIQYFVDIDRLITSYHKDSEGVKVDPPSTDLTFREILEQKENLQDIDRDI